jgi:DNA-binding response OmpR family regulator
MKIGILEDNQSLGRVLQLFLTKAGYTVYTSRAARDFLLFMASPERADLIVVDFRLLAERSEEESNLSGADVIRHIRTTSPDLPAILISAAPLATLEAAVCGLTGVKMLQKPFKMHYLLETIHSLT